MLITKAFEWRVGNLRIEREREREKGFRMNFFAKRSSGFRGWAGKRGKRVGKGMWEGGESVGMRTICYRADTTFCFTGGKGKENGNMYIGQFTKHLQ